MRKKCSDKRKEITLLYFDLDLGLFVTSYIFNLNIYVQLNKLFGNDQT